MRNLKPQPIQYIETLWLHFKKREKNWGKIIDEENAESKIEETKQNKEEKKRISVFPTKKNELSLLIILFLF